LSIVAKGAQKGDDSHEVVEDIIVETGGRSDLISANVSVRLPLCSHGSVGV
jgi:hypothetical protein